MQREMLMQKQTQQRHPADPHAQAQSNASVVRAEAQHERNLDDLRVGRARCTESNGVLKTYMAVNRRPRAHAFTLAVPT